jgi:uncharacterized membrane protein YiaA
LKPLTKTLNMKKQNVSTAFVAASWVALGAGMIGFIVGLARAEMQLNEKGYYFHSSVRTVCRGFFAESSA